MQVLERKKPFLWLRRSEKEGRCSREKEDADQPEGERTLFQEGRSSDLRRKDVVQEKEARRSGLERKRCSRRQRNADLKAH